MTLKKQERSEPEPKAQQPGADELSEQELETLAGGLPKQTCTGSGDSGMMGCPG